MGDAGRTVRAGDAEYVPSGRSHAFDPIDHSFLMMGLQRGRDILDKPIFEPEGSCAGAD